MRVLACVLASYAQTQTYIGTAIRRHTTSVCIGMRCAKAHATVLSYAHVSTIIHPMLVPRYDNASTRAGIRYA
eukprot:2196007-Rhodomonas_salina.1